MSEIKWLPEAVADLKRLYQFLEPKNQKAALKMVHLVQNGVSLLDVTPNIGKPMPDDTGRRELYIAFGAGAYVIRYKIVNENLLIIVRVWHSRENR